MIFLIYSASILNSQKYFDKELMLFFNVAYTILNNLTKLFFIL